MKNRKINLRFALATVLVVALYSYSSSQILVDTARNNVNATIPPTVIATQQNPITPANDSQHFYQWEAPILEKIDLKSIEMYKNDHEKYLMNIQTFENILKKNRQELNSYYQQAKDQSKVLSNERKNLKEKRNFYKQDEKLLKREKTLRDRELSLIQKERKTLKKQAKDLSSWDVENKMRQFDDREYRIEIAEEKWGQKREANQINLEKIADDEKKLDSRDFEIKERLRELDYFKRDLDLQNKQLALEKKQTQLEIKKAKAALKMQNKTK